MYIKSLSISLRRRREEAEEKEARPEVFELVNSSTNPEPEASLTGELVLMAALALRFNQVKPRSPPETLDSIAASFTVLSVSVAPDATSLISDMHTSPRSLCSAHL
jgi:hypothetical protein